MADGEKDHNGNDDLDHRETERWLADVRRCGTMELHRLRLTVDREYAERRRATEAAATEYERAAGRGASGRGAIIRIPVVVHVIYNSTTENISDTQIHNQIDVLNTDFRLLNSITDLTTDFSPVAADARIEFGLAVRDPQCNPTTGITRTFTSQTSWPDFSDAMKSAATGGHDPWPSDRYLNIWTIANGGSFIGWAEFPGGPANIDGVVIRHGVFGTGGTVPATSAFNGGRTATHEIGHWLNLIHIWGDEDGCVNSDNVADTPNQADANFGCPTHPSPSCGNAGDMFQNYMDYSDDGCYRLFTVGQVDRMRAALNTARTGILGSAGLVPPPSGGGVADLWIRDTADDVGTEPNPTTDVMYISPDIWVRQQDDGIADQTHQNAEYRPAGSGSNFVYVRVRNSSCATSASGTLKLYWAKASSGLSWPAPWDGSVTSPALMGDSIGTQPVTVAGGGSVIVTFPWSPPNPADYASFGADSTHFCLLARIETSATAPFGMTSAETSDLWANVKNNNNIAWKNISVVDEQPGGGRMESMLVARWRTWNEPGSCSFRVTRKAAASSTGVVCSSASTRACATHGSAAAGRPRGSRRFGTTSSSGVRVGWVLRQLRVRAGPAVSVGRPVHPALKTSAPLRPAVARCRATRRRTRDRRCAVRVRGDRARAHAIPHLSRVRVGRCRLAAGLRAAAAALNALNAPPFIGRWVRSYEEGTEDAQVYRPESYPFPPARGRAAIEIHADGTFVDTWIGPIEGTPPEIGTWTSTDGRTGNVDRSGKSSITFVIEDLDDGSQRVVVRRRNPDARPSV